ncbi:DUF3870 domain-containing protein [Lysinibacillus sphaericus]
MVPSNIVFIAGHARLPQGMAAKNVYDTLTITAEIERKYGVILEASCTLATKHGSNFIGRSLRGISLADGVEEATSLLQAQYKGKAINALTAAVKDLQLQFQSLKEEDSYNVRIFK